uniref:AWS domain-containing protein n=1 Tax=Soboliphyme baturini TaxID=241478 RepID=A0A183J6L4_9BILA
LLRNRTESHNVAQIITNARETKGDVNEKPTHAKAQPGDAMAGSTNDCVFDDLRPVDRIIHLPVVYRIKYDKKAGPQRTNETAAESALSAYCTKNSVIQYLRIGAAYDSRDCIDVGYVWNRIHLIDEQTEENIAKRKEGFLQDNRRNVSFLDKRCSPEEVVTAEAVPTAFDTRQRRRSTDGGRLTTAAMREMVGGCCVCAEDTGFVENPIVYCDGDKCNVAVHQGSIRFGFVSLFYLLYCFIVR